MKKFLRFWWPGLVAFGILASAYVANAEEPNVDWKSAGVGIGLLLAPIPETSSDLSWGHAIELEGFSYAGTDIMGRFMPKDYWFLAPICVTAADLMYRAGEGLDQDLTRRKLACDLLGVVARIGIEIKF